MMEGRRQQGCRKQEWWYQAEWYPGPPSVSPVCRSFRGAHYVALGRVLNSSSVDILYE